MRQPPHSDTTGSGDFPAVPARRAQAGHGRGGRPGRAARPGRLRRRAAASRRRVRPQVRGGVYSHGATGGGLKDTLEPYFPVTNPDIARCLQLYEPLLRWNAEYQIEPSVAESVTPNRGQHPVDDPAAPGRGVPPRQDGDRRGRPVQPGHGHRPEEHRLRRHRAGHHPRAEQLEDRRPADDPAAAQLALRGARPAAGRVHRRHPAHRLRRQPTPSAPDRSPTGSFVPGQLRQFARHENYWDGPPWVDELFIYDFADDAAKVNALLAGQVQSVDNLPNYLAGHHRAAGCLAVGLGDRRLGAVHHAGRRRAVLRRAGARRRCG